IQLQKVWANERQEELITRMEARLKCMTIMERDVVDAKVEVAKMQGNMSIQTGFEIIALVDQNRVKINGTGVQATIDAIVAGRLNEPKLIRLSICRGTSGRSGQAQPIRPIACFPDQQSIESDI
ncbi:hypothetical protein CPB85DRAFT_1294479, partial [Mucidula mucida]